MNEESRQINHDECIPRVIQNHQSIHQIPAVSSFSQKKNFPFTLPGVEKNSRLADLKKEAYYGSVNYSQEAICVLIKEPILLMNTHLVPENWIFLFTRDFP